MRRFDPGLTDAFLGLLSISLLGAAVACGGASRETAAARHNAALNAPAVPTGVAFEVTSVAGIQQQARGQILDAASFGANGGDRADDTQALQNAFDSVPTGGATVRLAAGTYYVADRLRINRPTALVGAGQNATRIVATGQGYHLLDATRSFAVGDLQLERAPAAVSTTFKAINLNLYRAPAGTPEAQLAVERVTITGFDTGVYTDGGARMLVTSTLVRQVQVESNSLSTVTPTTGYTPTVNLNRAARVEITNCQLVQPLRQQSNNVYLIGSERIRITDNTLRGGIGVKVVSGEIRPIQEVAIIDNRFESTSLSVLLISESYPFEQVTIEKNQFSQSRVLTAGSADVLITTQSGYRARPYAYRQVRLAQNQFRDVARGVVRVEMGDGNDFGTLVLEGNSYERWGTTEPGSYNVVSTGKRGRYGRLIASGETVDGRGVGRAYLGESSFASASFGDVVERSVRVPTSTRNEQLRLKQAGDSSAADLPAAKDDRPSGGKPGEEDQRRFVGKYESRNPPATMRVELVNGELRATVPGQPIYLLVPISPTRFRIQNAPSGYFIEFKLNQGKIVSLTVEPGRYPKNTLYPVR